MAERMPAYAKDDDVVCFFQSAQEFVPVVFRTRRTGPGAAAAAH